MGQKKKGKKPPQKSPKSRNAGDLNKDDPKIRFWNIYYNWVSRKKHKYFRFFLEALALLLILLVIIGSVIVVPGINKFWLKRKDAQKIRNQDFLIISIYSKVNYKENNLLYEIPIKSKLEIEDVSIESKIEIDTLPRDCYINNFNTNEIIGPDYNQDHKFSISCNSSKIPKTFHLWVKFYCEINENLELCQVADKKINCMENAFENELE